MKRIATIATVAATIVAGGCTSAGHDAITTKLHDNAVKAQAVRAPASHYEHGKRHFENGDYGLAVHRFELSLAHEGESVQVLNAIAASYDRLKRYDVAERLYGRALAYAPADPQTLNNLAFSSYLQGRHDQAQRYLQMAQANPEADREVIAANLQLVRVALDRPAARAVASAEERRLWVERTGVNLYTLVTTPSADVMHLAHATASDPRAFHVASASGVNAESAAVAAPRVRVTSAALRPVVIAAQGMPQVELASAQSASVASQGPSLGRSIVSAEISNGVGRNGLAARLRDFFATKHFDFQRVTNDESFDHADSMIFYQPEHRDDAMRLAALLARPIRIQAMSSLKSSIKLRIGRDLLYLDDRLSI